MTPDHRGNVPYRDAAVRRPVWERNAVASEHHSLAPRTLDGPVSCRGSPCGPASGAKVAASPGMEGFGYRLTAVGLRPRGSGPLWRRGSAAQALASRPASEASSPRSRALDPTFRLLVGTGSQPFGGRGPGCAIGARPFSSPAFGGVRPTLEGVDPDREPWSASWTVAQSRRRDENAYRTRIGCSGSSDRAGSARSRFASVPVARRRRFGSVVRRQADPSGRPLASALNRLAVGGRAPSALSRSAASRAPAAPLEAQVARPAAGPPLRDRRPSLAACPGILAVQPARSSVQPQIERPRSGRRGRGRKNDAALR